MKIPTAKDAVLYLWATAPKLLEALEVMKAWGFEYVTQAIWDKQVLGMGYWFRGQHEILMVGTKGKVPPPPEKMRVGSVISYPRTKHSRKPPEIRRLISKWYPDMFKVELFCREPAPGWHTWGNEVNSVADIEGGKVRRINTFEDYL